MSISPNGLMIIGAIAPQKNPIALLNPIPVPFSSGWISSITSSNSVFPAGSMSAIPIPINEIIAKKIGKFNAKAGKKKKIPNPGLQRDRYWTPLIVSPSKRLAFPDGQSTGPCPFPDPPSTGIDPDRR